MLERFVSVVGGMTMPFLLLAALAVSLTPQIVNGWPRASRARFAATGVGLAGAGVFATLRATAFLTSRTAVNLPAASALVVADVLLLMVLAVLVVRPAWGYEGRFSPVANTVACLVLALAFFRATPDTILQLSAFIAPGEATFSSEMLLRVLGFLGGWCAVAVLAFIYVRACKGLPRRVTNLAVLGFTVVMTGADILTLMRLLHATHRIVLPLEAFRLVVWATNNMQTMILFLAAAVFLVPLAGLFVASLRRLPDQPNPAVLRSRRADRRRSRRWVLASALGFSALVLTRTVALAKVNEVPQLSEPEPYNLDQGAGLARVPLSGLADGHLHRYAYAGSEGTEVRFIAILKNGGAYGVGLDACENCGPSGYYEKDGKVICKRCDVAINPATIGFKGGCNPIPVDFEVDGGDLTIATTLLEDSVKVFKR
ncbi:DUF2318 domain-containing protein [Actinomyces viscosus]|uniref:DUF2318 domain-containing protein n=1 Tax=Actinomyces viscosus TaxID=1656 RepID=UPI0028E678F2|nr:DUF2318 domain-containing protein [Actinomyces viscosus]